jgi:hypothetical protein
MSLDSSEANRAQKLPIEDGRWRKKLTPVEGVTDEDAASISIGSDPERGPVLEVGPWLAGEWFAGFEYGEALPLTTGTIRGMYRTEGVRHSGVRVGVSFYRDDTRIGTKTIWLGAAPEWTPFEFSIRVAAPSSNRIVPSFGLSEKTDGNAVFAEIEVTSEVVPFTASREAAEPIRKAPPDDFQKGDFFRLAERDGTWWLVAPEGRGFYSLGTDGPWFTREEDYRRTGLEHAEFLHRCGLNSLAGWTDIVRWGELNDILISQGKPPFAMFSAIKTPTHADQFDALVDAAGKDTGWDHDFPDPFDPRFEQWYRAQAQRRAKTVRGKSWFAGWFADNEVGHRELYRHVWSKNCAAAFKGHLQKQYRAVDDLNRAWGAAFASFDDLIAKKPDPIIQKGRMHEDFRAFEREIVKQYIDVTIRAWREADPDHLIISNRFMLDDVGGWTDVLDLYRAYDAVAVNLYPANQRPGLSEDEREIYRMAHEKTGRPVIVGEWSVPAADSGLYDKPDKLDWSFNELLPTQSERALQAAQVTVDFYNMPFVVGSHWFIWKDIVNEQREANRGLFTHDDRPWQDVADALAAVHNRIRAV